MSLIEHAVPGLYELARPVHSDDRGWFSKPFQRSTFEELGVVSEFGEQFFSHSLRNVVRGLHLQIGAGAQWKLVTCLAGGVYDVVVDLRPESPMFQRYQGFDLTAESGRSLLIPPGCAHGFAVTADSALLGYWVDAEYDAACDTGVHWDSAGIDWPVTGEPIVSQRDRELPSMLDFDLAARSAAVLTPASV